MSRRLLLPLLVGGGVIAVLVVILVAVPGRSKDARTYLQPGAAATGTDSGVDSGSGDALGPSPRCTAVDIALSPEERAGGATFADLVAAEPGSGEVTAAGAVFLFMDLQRHIDYGPWEPAVSYLRQSARFSVDHTGSLPTRSAEVVAAAERVDRDLAAGSCR